MNAKKMPLRVHENVLVFYRKLPTYNPQFVEGKAYFRPKTHFPSVNYSSQKNSYDRYSDGKRFPRDILEFTFENYRQHPTQKPTDLLEYLIKTYTNEGELVLDATIGSGSTAVAAINTGRHFIGFETEKNFFDIANERIAKAYEEQGLFKQNLPSTGDKADNQNVGE